MSTAVVTQEQLQHLDSLATTLHDSPNLPVKEFRHLSDFSELKI